MSNKRFYRNGLKYHTKCERQSFLHHVLQKKSFSQFLMFPLRHMYVVSRSFATHNTLGVLGYYYFHDAVCNNSFVCCRKVF